MKRLVVVVVVVAGLLGLARSADAKCAMQHLSAEVLPDAPGGAIVMLTSSSYDDPGTDDTSAWKLRVAGQTIAPVIDVLAPGLSVYRVPKGLTEAELTDGTSTLAKIGARTGKPLPAPVVTSVTHSSPDGGRYRSSRTTAEIRGDVPADAIAVVITDAKGTALSWGRVNVPGAAVTPYFHGRCGVLPNGTVGPKVGSRVRLFWVDKYGRASAKSAAIKVAKAP